MKKALSTILAILMIIPTLAAMSVSASTAQQNTIPDKEETVGYDAGRVLEVSNLDEKVKSDDEGTIAIPKTLTWTDSVLDFKAVYKSDGIYTIETAEQLETFGRLVRLEYTFDNATVYVTDDIDCKELTNTDYMLGIGAASGAASASKHFKGTFDGQGYVISNWKVANTYQGSGFFNTVSGATLQNIVLDNTITVNNGSKAQAGGLVGQAYNAKTVINNCLIMSQVTTTGSQAGGIVGAQSSAAVDVLNTTFAGSVSAGNRIGGIIGTAGSTVTVDNCLVTGSLKLTGSASVAEKNGIGGFVGDVHKASATFNNSISAAEIICANSCEAVAPIAGIINTSSASLTLSGVYNYGKITVAGEIKSAQNAYGAIVASGVYTEGNTYFDFSSDVGGAVRIDPKYSMGLRFGSVIPASIVAEVTEKYGDVSYGTLIAPADYLDGNPITVSNIIGAGKTYLDIEATSNGMSVDQNGNVFLKAAITNLYDANLARDFVSVPYISYTDADGDTVYRYVPQLTERNAKEVATAALNDLSQEKSGIYQNEITVDGVVKFSPYTAEQRNFMNEKYLKEVQ